MNNLYHLLQKIKENPALYLDKPSITCLHSFLNGYLDTRLTLGLDREGSGIEGFQEWIQEKEKTNVCQSWAGIIIFTTGSERRSFYRFFELFEQFLNKKRSKKNNYEHEQITRTYEFYQLLEWIEKRPGMFLGTSSITKLDMLLRGYNLARREADVPPNKQEREFADFQIWIQEKYGINSSQSWAKIILFYSMDEQEALENFFELYKEYLNWDKNSEVDRNVKNIRV